MGTRIAIIGSRNTGNVDFNGMMENILNQHQMQPMEIISGGARGYDTLAAEWAKAQGIKLTELRPDYDKNGKAAPFIRNRNIVDRADFVVAFWDMKSRGTKYTIDYASRKNKTIIIVPTDGDKTN